MKIFDLILLSGLLISGCGLSGQDSGGKAGTGGNRSKPLSWRNWTPCRCRCDRIPAEERSRSQRPRRQRVFPDGSDPAAGYCELSAALLRPPFQIHQYARQVDERQTRILLTEGRENGFGGIGRHRDPDRFRMLGAEPGVLASGKLPGDRRDPFRQFGPLELSFQERSDFAVSQHLPCGR